MLKKHSQFFQSIFLISDSIILIISWAIGYCYRFLTPIYETDPVPSFRIYFLFSLILPFIWWFAASIKKLYKSRRILNILKEISDIIQVTVIYFLLTTGFIHFLFRDVYSRLVIFTHCIFFIILICIYRFLFRTVLRFFRKKGFNKRYVMIVGTGKLARRVYRSIKSHPGLGFEVKGFISEDGKEGGSEIDGIRIAGTIENLNELLRKHEIDLLLISLPVEKLDRIKLIMNKIENELVSVQLVPDFSELFTLTGSVDMYDGLVYVSLQDTPFEGWNKISKRLFDIVFGILFSILSLPVMIFIVIIMKIFDRGPLLYKQERIGLDGKKFYIYKFRTMKMHEESDGQVTQATKDDERVTVIGKILRKLSLDELPQFYNVIKGDMSIVGPRPHAIAHNEEFKNEFPKYMLRHKVKSGITGWAQVNGWRGEINTRKKLRKRIQYDLYYIENWSILFDIKIVFLTIFKGFINKNAY